MKINPANKWLWKGHNSTDKWCNQWLSITDPFFFLFQKHTRNTKEQTWHRWHKWKANVFITKTKPFTEQNIEQKQREGKTTSLALLHSPWMELL